MDNHTALITGASKRIGRALAEHLAEKGWNVVIHFNTSETEAEQLRQLLQERYPNQQFTTAEANLASPDETDALIPEVVTKVGEFQLLINNASVFNRGYISQTDRLLYTSQMNVNLRAPFFLIREFAKYCKQGNIINFVDTKLATNQSNYSAYSLSKKSLWELTKMAALEFAPEYPGERYCTGSYTGAGG